MDISWRCSYSSSSFLIFLLDSLQISANLLIFSLLQFLRTRSGMALAICDLFMSSARIAYAVAAATRLPPTATNHVINFVAKGVSKPIITDYNL